MNWADNFSWPMSSLNAFAVLYARHCTWQWNVPQSVGWDIQCANLACEAGIVFG